MQLLLGLAVIFAVGWAAELLHLRLLEFIFNNGTQAIVIAAIVLFQPELRRALDQVGRLGTVRTVLGRHPELAYASTADEVLRAAGSLAERKVGALIVFERETGLENLAATGVHVNGDVTGEMLATIFIPGSPLHDGAVIIRESRIVAAGCVLPLAETLPGVGRMGTRHRAALGLTMQSDAVVLIVSEETGLISVAHDGKIYRGLDQAKLHEMLVELLTREGGSGRARRCSVRCSVSARCALLGAVHIHESSRVHPAELEAQGAVLLHRVRHVGGRRLRGQSAGDKDDFGPHSAEPGEYSGRLRARASA